METVVIGLEQLVDLTRGRTITCGPVRVRVGQDDLDGLMAALRKYNTMRAFEATTLDIDQPAQS